MPPDLWPNVTVFLALIFHDKRDRDGTLRNSFNFASQMNLATRSQLLLWVPENAFTQDTPRPPHPLPTQGDRARMWKLMHVNSTNALGEGDISLEREIEQEQDHEPR